MSCNSLNLFFRCWRKEKKSTQRILRPKREPKRVWVGCRSRKSRVEKAETRVKHFPHFGRRQGLELSGRGRRKLGHQSVGWKTGFDLEIFLEIFLFLHGRVNLLCHFCLDPIMVRVKEKFKRIFGNLETWTTISLKGYFVDCGFRFPYRQIPRKQSSYRQFLFNSEQFEDC